MNKIVLVSLLLFFEINANGIQPSDSNFNSKNPINIPLNGQKIPPLGGTQHAPALSLVSAYIDNGTVNVDFALMYNNKLKVQSYATLKILLYINKIEFIQFSIDKEYLLL
jgi:hypothetical protein